MWKKTHTQNMTLFLASIVTTTTTEVRVVPEERGEETRGVTKCTSASARDVRPGGRILYNIPEGKIVDFRMCGLSDLQVPLGPAASRSRSSCRREWFS